MSRLLLDMIGLCEHCNTLLNIEGMPSEAAGAEWPCPSCKKNTTHLSFGYEEVTPGKWEKTRWVGKVKGNFGWVNKKPLVDFTVRGQEVWIETPY